MSEWTDLGLIYSLQNKSFTTVTIYVYNGDYSICFLTADFYRI